MLVIEVKLKQIPLLQLQGMYFIFWLHCIIFYSSSFLLLLFFICIWQKKTAISLESVGFNSIKYQSH